MTRCLTWVFLAMLLIAVPTQATRSPGSLVVLATVGTQVFINGEYAGVSPLLSRLPRQPATIELTLEGHFPVTYLLEPPFGRQTIIEHAMVMEPETLRAKALTRTKPEHPLQLFILDYAQYEPTQVGHNLQWTTRYESSRAATVCFHPDNLLGVVERQDGQWVLLDVFSLTDLAQTEVQERVHEAIKHTFHYVQD